LVDTRKDAIVVPTAAVQRGPNFIFVYVVQPDDTVELRTVTVGLSEAAETSVESGLSPGEVVVTEGLDKLQKGSTITTIEKEKAKEKDKEKGEGKDKEKGKDSKEKNPKMQFGDQKTDSAEQKPKATADSTSQPDKKGSK
jgi:multidrug efflux system membrane fusion protein